MIAVNSKLLIDSPKKISDIKKYRDNIPGVQTYNVFALILVRIAQISMSVTLIMLI
jgi:hypothetical protein